MTAIMLDKIIQAARKQKARKKKNDQLAIQPIENLINFLLCGLAIFAVKGNA